MSIPLEDREFLEYGRAAKLLGIKRSRREVFIFCRDSRIRRLIKDGEVYYRRSSIDEYLARRADSAAVQMSATS